MLVGRAKYPGKEELAELAAADIAGSNGKDAGVKTQAKKLWAQNRNQETADARLTAARARRFIVARACRQIFLHPDSLPLHLPLEGESAREADGLG